MRILMKLGVALVFTTLIFALAGLDQNRLPSWNDVKIGFPPVFFLN